LAGIVAYFASNVYLDLPLAKLSARIRATSPPSEPVVHLNEYYYLSMREFYLPERVQFLYPGTPKFVNWAALPGYAPAIALDRLATLDHVVVFDPDRSLSKELLWRTTGADLARRLHPVRILPPHLPAENGRSSF
jgi:hypothetical protein